MAEYSNLNCQFSNIEDSSEFTLCFNQNFKINTTENIFLNDVQFIPESINQIKESDNISEKIKVKYFRILQRDSIYKKFKTLLIGFIRNTINKYLRHPNNIHLRFLNNRPLKLKKLPVNFTSSVSIRSIKKFLNLNIEQLFTLFYGIQNNKLHWDNFTFNKNVIKIINNKSKDGKLNEFIKTRIDDLINTNSEFIKFLNNKLTEIKEKFCSNMEVSCNGACVIYINQFKYLILGAEGFVNYFKNSQGYNKKMKNKSNEIFKIIKN